MLALEKGIKLELVDEDLQNKSPRLLSANPLGKVPTLILDDGKTIFDSPVICQYLDALNDKPIFIPRSGEKRYEVLKWEAMADDLMTVGINAYMEKTRHPKDFSVPFVAAQEAGIHRAYTYIEARLDSLREFTLAPVAVASAIGYVHFRLPHLEVKGALAQWFTEISKRPSLAQTVPTA